MNTELNNIVARPFIKWAGGKTQLLDTFEQYYPKELINKKVKRYIEPFIGSGAVLFDILQRYNIEEAYIMDINKDLLVTYEAIQRDVNALIDCLAEIEVKYLAQTNEERKTFYYNMRDIYNTSKEDFNYDEFGNKTIERAVQFIFLNRTCFNGLFRVNRKGHFNVPMGDYKNPSICNSDNLKSVSNLLQRVKIIKKSYEHCEECIEKNTFVYFDPPYRPLNGTAFFTSYNMDEFGDEQQKELAAFYSHISSKGTDVYLMLSNSDPKNNNQDDTFFEELYKGFNINTVKARRAINSKGNKRGQINELIITNY